MTRHIALLYSVVLEPGRRVKNAELVEVGERAGVAVKSTVLSTGNLIFEADALEAELEQRLEEAVVDRLRRSIQVFVRTADAWRFICASNPFAAQAVANPALVAARIMRNAVPPDVADRIRSKIGPGEDFAVDGRTMWLTSTLQLSTSPLIRAAGAKWAGDGTFRNASALAKIAAALDV